MKYLEFPKIIRIEPSSLCNLKCLHCSTGTKDIKRELMNEETFSLIIKNIKKRVDCIKVVVLYHGGEPLVNEKFEDMVAELKNIGIKKIKTVSNGMLLNEERIDSIINSNLDEIEFSLDGDSINQNNMIRKGCDYQKVVHNIKLLLLKKRNLNKSIPEITISNTQFLTSKTMNSCVIDSCNTPAYLLKEFSEELKSGDSINFKCNYAMCWPDMNIDKEIFDLKEVYVGRDDYNYCDNINSTITIRSNGNIVPCCYDLTNKTVLGNINNKTIEEIWNNDEYNSLRENISNYIYPEMCKKCNVVNQKSKVYLIIKDID